ncbi:MAG: DUF2142 domain-containing protein [Solirubrobacteraceae bacterium]
MSQSLTVSAQDRATPELGQRTTTRKHNLARWISRARRAPTAAWACALIAFLNGAAWSLITPPFQGRDEADHFAYVQTLAEQQTLPAGGSYGYSSAEVQVLTALHQDEIRFSPQTPAISTAGQQQVLEQADHAGLPTGGRAHAAAAASEPPLYYALETLPYFVGSGDVLLQLELMRLVSALIGAVCVLFIFVFIREALPASPRAATAGCLCAAMFPLFGFMSGTLNPEVLLYVVAAAAFFCLSRAYRRGLTFRGAVAMGLILAAGFLTKINFVGIGLGISAGLVVLTARQVRVKGWSELRLLAIAAALGSAPVIVYALVNVRSGTPTLGIASSGASSATRSVDAELSYIWQLYLPRLPGMTKYFAGLTTYRDIWFDRLVGFYGWIDTMFPVWLNDVALLPAGAIALLCARELFVRRSTVRHHLWEIATYAAMGVGLLVLVGETSYLGDVVNHTEAFTDTRYLLPLLALFAAAVTLAIRGAGRRWSPVVAVIIVALFYAHDLFSQLQVISRYYG